MTGVDVLPDRAAMAAAGVRRVQTRELRRQLLVYLGLLPFVIIAVFPVYWMAITAFKSDNDLVNPAVFPFWFHQSPTLEHFTYLFEHTYYGSWLYNTMAIAFWVSVITLAAAVPAGYALARVGLPGAENMGIGIFLGYLIPPVLLFIPLSRVVSISHLIETKWALVLVYPTFTIPYCTWLLSGFFKTVPPEIEEAALVDGCGPLAALIRVVLPVSIAGILTAVIFAFTLTMQDFLYALVYVSISDQKPVPLGVATDLIRGDVYFWGSLMAGALFVGIPVAILYSFFLDQFIAGITGAAIK
ncbi:MAG: carbohydrate ABC transporter permease [Bacillati bacterium ANGP1]|uniref:Carbohydrate ABC transporter permease n=1 Tax=Candidatus Segetimicrobium genomatis TaxID=2569760 RepID=A0A537LRV6_9BACT|nr:MAG: carbohydrate ABC transporter permease [Terrabacteria group bacterium ANGP1]